MTDEQLSDVFCAMCQRENRAAVSLGDDNFPRVRWLTPHVDRWPSRTDHLEAIAQATGEILELTLDGNLVLASEAFDRALAVNDSKYQPASSEWGAGPARPGGSRVTRARGPQVLTDFRERERNGTHTYRGAR